MPESLMPSFADLRSAALTRSVMRASIETVKGRVLALGWDVAGPGREDALKLLHHPDQDYPSFSSWLRTVLEQALVYDALVLHVPRSGGFRVMEGSLFEPAIGQHGEHLGLRQYLYGPVERRSTGEIFMSPTPGAISAWESGGPMWYFARSLRPWTPFGFPPVEKAMHEPDEKIPLAFGISPRDIGLDSDDEADPLWQGRFLKWLAGVFTQLLGNGLAWKWDLGDLES